MIDMLLHLPRIPEYHNYTWQNCYVWDKEPDADQDGWRIVSLFIQSEMPGYQKFEVQNHKERE